MSKGASARILFAWELGDNHGHLVRHVQIAKTLRMRGHPVMFVARNTTIAHSALASSGFHFLQAPIYQTKPRENRPTTSYADILLESGYADPDELDGLLRSWTTTLSLFKPDLLIADHAPTALLAARVLNIQAMLIGTGFEIPPLVDPFPSLVSWRPVDPIDLAKSSAVALKNINECLGPRKAQSLSKLSALFSGKRALVTSAAELDPYEPRDNVRYIGAIGPSAAGRMEKWSTSAETKVFVYLNNDVGQLTTLIEALRAMEVEAVCVFPRVDDNKLPSSTTRIRFFNRLVHVDGILPQANLCISNGGNGLAGKCLEFGVPMLLLPVYLEQYVTARLVAKLGAGMAARSPLSVEQYASVVEKAARLSGPGVLAGPNVGESVCKYQAAVDEELVAIGS